MPDGRRAGTRGGLGLRISLLAALVAVVTALVAGGLAVSLTRQAAVNSARTMLRQVADDAAADATVRGRATLKALRITIGLIDARGAVSGPNRLTRTALTPAEVTKVLGGGRVSAARQDGGVAVLIEARPIVRAGGAAGGIVLVQRRTDALALRQIDVGRLVIALAVAVGVAAAVGLAVAWRLARPLRRTAAAAHALADGRRDVTLVPTGPAEVAEVADAVNRLAGNLAHSESRQREFLLSVSHDLRTPLTAIRGYAESLADGVIPGDQTPRVGGVILAESQRLTRLVGDLLDLARLDARDFRVEPADVDLARLAEDAAAVWTGRCAAAGPVFSLERPPYPLPARTDPARLRQALDGLLDNALRVTPAGRPIVLAVRGEAGGVVAEVRDGGPGLTDADLAVAFDRSALYDRYRGVRQVGTGLGLAIVHSLVARLGGTVEAGHAAEGGARFTVRLPPVRGPQTPPAA